MSDEKVYVDDVGTIILINCGEDISEASDVSMVVKKPDGTETEWDATVHTDDESIKHIISEGEINLPGKYKIQPLLTIGEWTGKGKTVILEIDRKYD